MSEATKRIADGVATFVPGLLALLALLVVAVIVATVARLLVGRGLVGIDFDRRAPQWG